MKENTKKMVNIQKLVILIAITEQHEMTSRSIYY